MPVLKRALDRTLKAVIDPDQWRLSGAVPWDPGASGAGASLLVSSVNFSSYTKMYRNSVAIRSVVNFRSATSADVPFKTYRRHDEDVREALDDHGFSTFLHDPNPELTEITFKRDVFTDLDLFDCTFWKKKRAGGKLILVRMFPDAVSLEGDAQFPDGFNELQKDGSTKFYTRDSVFWMHGWGGVKGISRLEGLRLELEADEQERTHREQMSRMGWRNTGIIKRPKSAGQWSDKARKRFVQQMNSRYGANGPMSGRPLILEEDMDWINDSTTAEASDYTAARYFTTKQVCFAFNMSPQIMGLEGAPYSSQQEYKVQLYQVILAPRLNETSSEFEKQLLTEFTDIDNVYIDPLIEQMLQGDPVTQANIARSAVGGPYIPPNEWRASVLNRHPLPGGDTLVTPKLPSNTGGQANVAGGVANKPAKPATPKPSQNQLPKAASQDPPEEDDPPVTEPEPIKVPGRPVRLDIEKRFTDQWNRVFTVFKSHGELEKRDIAGLYQLQALEISNLYGQEASDIIGTVFDSAKTVAFWNKTSNLQASLLYKALMTESSIKGTIKTAPVILARTIMTQAENWAKLEAFRQANVKGVKTWKVKDPNSRHKLLNNELIPMEETFLNGLMYPGDSTGPLEEISGCQCYMDVDIARSGND